MDHQGARRTRPGPDQRVPGGTGPQPRLGSGSGAASGAQRIMSPGTGPQRLIGPGTGAQPRLGPGTGAQPRLGSGSGAHRVLGPGTGPGRLIAPGATGSQPALGGPGASGFTGSFPRTPPVRGFPPGRERGGPKRGRRLRMEWLATAVVVVAAAGLAGYKYLYEPRVNAPVPSTLRLPASAPGSPGFDKALGKWQHIGTRTGDPEPLTITELYPPQFVLNGASYTRTAASVTKTCSLAVYGADLQAALQSGHCSQVVRASYLSGDGKMMGTVGVVNLISSSAAQKAGQVTGPQEIIAPLTGKKGATSKLGDGTGVVQAEIKGHYLILMWAEYANLKSPSGAAQPQALEQFAANLVTGSANIDLSTRMLTGKP